MQLIKDLLRVARTLLIQRLLALLSKRILHLNEQVVVLYLCLSNYLLVRICLIHKRHVVLQARLLLTILLMLLALILLILIVALLVLFSEIHFIRELLIRILHCPQVLLDLLD